MRTTHQPYQLMTRPHVHVPIHGARECQVFLQQSRDWQVFIISVSRSTVPYNICCLNYSRLSSDVSSPKEYHRPKQEHKCLQFCLDSGTCRLPLEKNFGVSFFFLQGLLYNRSVIYPSEFTFTKNLPITRNDLIYWLKTRRKYRNVAIFILSDHILRLTTIHWITVTCSLFAEVISSDYYPHSKIATGLYFILDWKAPLKKCKIVYRNRINKHFVAFHTAPKATDSIVCILSWDSSPSPWGMFITPRLSTNCPPATVQNLTCLTPHVTNWLSESGLNSATNILSVWPCELASLIPKNRKIIALNEPSIQQTVVFLSYISRRGDNNYRKSRSLLILVPLLCSIRTNVTRPRESNFI